MADAPNQFGSTPVNVIPGQSPEFMAKFNAAPIQVSHFNAAKAFIRHNRIHLQHGSYFDAHNPLIIIHPRELRPENSNRLRLKVRRALEQDVPPYFADPQIGVFAEQFIKMMPLSVAAKQEAVSKAMVDLMNHQTTGIDPGIAKEQKDSASPFAAEIEMKLKKNEIGAVEKEMLKNGLGLYLIVNHGLEKQFDKGLSEFFSDVTQKHPESPEALFAQLQPFTGIHPREMIEAAHAEGLSGVAKKLGVDDAYVQEVKLMLEVMPEHMFSLNALEAWEAGRKRPGMQALGPEEKMRVGMIDLITDKIDQARKALRSTDLSPQMKPMEQMFAAHLNLLPPELAETHLLLGTEFAYTPDPNLKNISGVQAYGFYRRIVKHPGDLNGVYHVFISGHNGPESFAETLIHEAHHLVMPSRLSAADIQKVDTLALAESKRLYELKGLVTGWMSANAAGNEQAKAAIMQDLDTRFGVNGKTFSQALGNMDMTRVYQMVNETFNQLQIDSNFYYKSGYDSPSVRFAEVFSRYAQMRFGRWRENPELMNMIVPNITQAYNEVYMPHIRSQLADMKAIRQSFAPAQAAPQPGAIASAQQPETPASGRPTTGHVELMSDWANHNRPLSQIMPHTANLIGSPLAVQEASLTL